MEDLSFSDQRNLMNETNFLISNHGAGLTNMLFMKEGSSVIELKSNAEDINNCFFNLASALNHKYFYTINSGDSPDVQKSNITVDLEKLKTLLQNLF
jgi:capsular polysaccharide biosynthesis protein